jgi:DNA-cytosine methyltransferase
MNVLSLFDGISCARVALGNKVKKYYASEIDKNAIKVAQKNFPSTIHVGDVKGIKVDTIKDPIDLLIGGSPCTDLSIAKKGRKGLEGDQSKLFWEYIRVKKLFNPKWFILENVASMPLKDKDIITKELGVEPIMIDAALVSAQSRKRLFWTNIPNVRLPEDRKITLQSILQIDADIKEEDLLYRDDAMTKTAKKEQSARGMSIRGRQDASGVWVQTLDVRKDEKVSALTSTCSSKLALVGRIVNRRLDKDGKRHDGDKNVPQTKVVEERTDGKCGTLTNVSKDNVVIQKFVQIGYFGDKNASGVGGQALRVYDANFKSTTSGVGYYKTIHSIRKLTPIECERLQGLPDHYTDGIAKTARYRAIGNGFHVEVIKHITNQIPLHGDHALS